MRSLARVGKGLEACRSRSGLMREGCPSRVLVRAVNGEQAQVIEAVQRSASAEAGRRSAITDLLCSSSVCLAPWAVARSRTVAPGPTIRLDALVTCTVAGPKTRLILPAK